jgi:hypothetical protein
MPNVGYLERRQHEYDGQGSAESDVQEQGQRFQDAGSHERRTESGRVVWP